MRRDDDHEFGLRALVFGAAEQRPKDRNVAQPRHLTVQVAEVVLQQAGDGEAFAVAHLDRGRGFAALEGVDREAGRCRP